MKVTKDDVIKCFGILFESLQNKNFAKTFDFTEWNEQELLPLVRAFLLGYFGSVEPEVKAILPSAPTGHGRIDFIVGATAIEFAVRNASAGKAVIKDYSVRDEMQKLMKYEGLSFLVIFDFSNDHLIEEDIENMKKFAHILLHKNHKISTFHILYFFVDEGSSYYFLKMVKP